MKQTFRFLLRPTARQSAALASMLEDHRQLYNAALEERRAAWRKRVYVNYYRQATQLPEIRKFDPEGQGRWSAGSQQQTLRRLDRAFAAFFRRIKSGEKPGYPRFKGRGHFDSVDWPAQKNGARWDSVPHPTVTRVYLLGIGHVRVNLHRQISGRVKMITVQRERDRWYVNVSCDDVPARPLPATANEVGIDLGISSFLTTSTGIHFPNTCRMTESTERLTRARKDLARKKCGSTRKRKALSKVGAIQSKMRRQRLDYAHKTALALVQENYLIVHEALRIADLARRPKPKPDPDNPGAFLPNGAKLKSVLNRSIYDAGWGNFLRILHAKAESAGRVVIAVDPRHTSQTCAECGHVAAGNRVSQAEFRCLACGHQAHADVNAAINILRAGLVLQAKAA